MLTENTIPTCPLEDKTHGTPHISYSLTTQLLIQEHRVGTETDPLELKLVNTAAGVW
jgi:hypothetical protein